MTKHSEDCLEHSVMLGIRIWICMFLGLPDPDLLVRASEVLIRIRILPFPHKGVERAEIMLAK